MNAAQPTIMLIVRGLKSQLSRKEFERRYKERLPQFRNVTGLIQKYYCYDESTGEWAGIYLWDTEESLSNYLESELRKSISTAYELTEPPRVERFPIVDALRAWPERAARHGHVPHWNKGRKMKASWKGETIAESESTIVVEGNHYFPPGSVSKEHLEPSSTTTECPWKGTAHYYNVVVGDEENRDAAWYYPDPKEAAAEIENHVAFWRGVDLHEG
jgi:uncharacterized protein (DUF427 family)